MISNKSIRISINKISIDPSIRISINQSIRTSNQLLTPMIPSDMNIHAHLQTHSNQKRMPTQRGRATPQRKINIRSKNQENMWNWDLTIWIVLLFARTIAGWPKIMGFCSLNLEFQQKLRRYPVLWGNCYLQSRKIWAMANWVTLWMIRWLRFSLISENLKKLQMNQIMIKRFSLWLKIITNWKPFSNSYKPKWLHWYKRTKNWIKTSSNRSRRWMRKWGKNNQQKIRHCRLIRNSIEFLNVSRLIKEKTRIWEFDWKNKIKMVQFADNCFNKMNNLKNYRRSMLNCLGSMSRWRIDWNNLKRSK